MLPGDGKKADESALADTAFSAPSCDPALAGTVLPESSERSAVSGAMLRPFGPYSRAERLGDQGAMGVVARGYSAAFDRWELLKFLRPDLADQPEYIRQFFREGRVLAKLSHPNIVQVFAIYALDGTPCLAMEFLEGVSLGAFAAKERCSIVKWHELFLDAARGLSAAHEVGLLHRDLKPENLFVVDDHAGARKGSPQLKLIDFGLATADRSRHADASHDPTLVAAMSGGTPLYMAPELWFGEEASPRSDLYALGQSFFVALTGRLPFMGDTVGQVRNAVCSPDPFPDARDLRPDLPAPLALVLARTIAKRKEDRIASADDLVAALVAAASAARPRRVPGAGPYRGLGSYSAAERDVFFGRDTEVIEVLEHLCTQNGVVLVGPGGSGKSSLAQAGVVPAIEEGALGAGLAYGSVLLVPRTHPVHSLAAALARRLGSSEEELLGFIRATPGKVGASLRAALPAEAGLVLVIDQLEELATLAEDPSDVHTFAIAVASLIEVGSAAIRVIATLRADLMDRLFAIEPLRPLLTRGFYPVRPMGREALRQAMTGPALAASYRLEDPGLVDEVIDDVARTAGGLPLLSFAMAAWWDARDEVTRTLPTAAWTELGGLTGALVRHGDRVLAAMTVDARRLAEQILLRLVSADRTRSRASRASLLDPAASGPGAAHVLDRLVGAKLVHESGGELELVHEALITRWPALRALLVSSGEDRAFRERVTAAAREWDAQRRPDGALWTGDQASRLARWFHATNAPLDQLDLAFIEAVRRRERRSRVVVRSLTTGVVLALLAYGLVARSNETELRRRLDVARASLREKTSAYVQAETGRLNELAALEIQRDPGGSLRHAAASHELEHDRTLDVMAWNARAMGVAIALPGLGGPVASVRVAPRTRWIAAAGPDAVQLLSADSSDHVVLPVDRSTSGSPRALGFSDDGQSLVVGLSTGAIMVGKAPGFDLREVGRCDGSVQEVDWTTSGILVADCRSVAGARRVVHVDVASGQMTPVLALPGDPTALEQSTNGAGATLTIDTRHVAELRVPGRPRPLEIEVATAAVAWIPARDALALVGPSGDVLLVSLATLDVIARIPSPGHELVALGADPAGEWLVGGARDGAVLAFNLEQGSVAVTQGRVVPAPSTCGLSPDGGDVVCAAGGNALVRVVLRSRGVPRPPSMFALPVPPDAIAVGAGGAPVFAIAGGAVTRDGRTMPPLLARGELAAVGDRLVAIAGTSADGRASVAVAPLSPGDSPLPPMALPGPVTAFAWSSDGARLSVATADRKLRTLGMSKGALVALSSLDLPSGAVVRALAVSDDGSRTAMGMETGEVFLVSREGGAARKVADLHAPVRCLAVAHAGRALVASGDRRVSVIDGDTGLAFALSTTSSPVARCARSPGEDRFSFVEDDGTTWLKALDLADVADSYVPQDPANAPALAAWKGLPVWLVR